MKEVQRPSSEGTQSRPRRAARVRWPVSSTAIVRTQPYRCVVWRGCPPASGALCAGRRAAQRTRHPSARRAAV
eukprot:scaffold8646_cov115-Isochrysis_galbana.AAC.7